MDVLDVLEDHLGFDRAQLNRGHHQQPIPAGRLPRNFPHRPHSVLTSTPFGASMR